MDRRTFIGTGCALLGARGARAAAGSRVYRIGLIEAVPPAQNAANLDALRRGLRERGYEEGRNLVIEYRSSDGRPERFPDLVADLARLKVDLIIARGTPAAQAAKSGAGTTPVVMATMGDPRALVTSFAHPGGHVTGLTTFSTELTAKRVELLKELVPSLARIALLHDLANPAARAEWAETQGAARALGLHAELLDVRRAADLGAALARAVPPRVEALVVGADGLLQRHQREIVDWAASHRLPSAFAEREAVAAGALLAYGVNYPDLYERFAAYADKIMRGAAPGELPVEQPTRFQLVVNLAAAQALGLSIPPALRLRADELIR